MAEKRLMTAALFDTENTLARPLLEKYEYPWEILDGLSAFITELGGTLGDDYLSPCEGVWINKTAKVAPTAFISAPCIICEEAEIRHCAYIRGSALIGKHAVVGNSCEVKNSVFFDYACAPHFNYVGDSVLGKKAHLGAGAVTSNLKSDRTPVTVKIDGVSFPTGRKKFGSAVGDGVEVGCNSVLCPGAVIGKNSTVYPLSRVRGYVGENKIFKSPDNITGRM